LINLNGLGILVMVVVEDFTSLDKSNKEFDAI
jgi:hypothetical protein